MFLYVKMKFSFKIDYSNYSRSILDVNNSDLIRLLKDYMEIF